MKLQTIATVLLSAWLWAGILPGQIPPKRTLEGIIARHQAELAKAGGDPAAYQVAVKAYVTVLREYLQDEASGDEKCETRFALVSLLMVSGQREAAKSTLSGIDLGNASGIMCATAAEIAQGLGMARERAAWIRAALGKSGSFGDRMELGVILMTALNEVAQAERLFANALEQAKSPAAKARVVWHITRATREREDLPEGAYAKALRQLAKDYPATRYGKIAADRLRAMDFKVGGEPIPLRIASLRGEPIDLAKQRGKVVLACFLADEIPGTATAAPALQALHEKHGDEDLVVIGIWLDEAKTSSTKAIERLKLTFPQAWADGGWDSDIALRFRVENAPQCLLIGRDGKIAGMNFLLTNQWGLGQLGDAVRQAVGK